MAGILVTEQSMESNLRLSIRGRPAATHRAGQEA